MSQLELHDYLTRAPRDEDFGSAAMCDEEWWFSGLGGDASNPGTRQVLAHPAKGGVSSSARSAAESGRSGAAPLALFKKLYSSKPASKRNAVGRRFGEAAS